MPASTITSRSAPASAPAAATESSAARERIVETARRHFLAQGFRAVTMDDLAAELGMSKKTFYTSFPGKTSLVEAVILHKFTNISADLSAVTEREDLPFPAKLEALLAVMMRHVGELQPAFIRDLKRDAPELFDLVREKRAGLINVHFGRVMRDGREAGMVRRDVPQRLILEVLLGAVEAIVNPAKLDELNLTPKAAVTVILKILLDGALTKTASGAL
jgi:AcrR family transcriptional regulator